MGLPTTVEAPRAARPEAARPELTRPELTRPEVTRPEVTLDLTRVVVTAEVVAGAVAVAYRLSRRPSAPKAQVTMGPGGWVSMKGGTVSVRPARRPFGRPRKVRATKPHAKAPLWARVLSAVPLEALRLDAGNKRFILDADKDRLKDAPGFDKDHWPDFADPAFADRVHAYYGTTPH